jgi:hypothetical protein
MQIPAILGETKTLAVNMAGGRGMSDQDSPPQALALDIPGQQQNNWCWAAVSVGIADFYFQTGESQCAFATRVLDNKSGERCCRTSRGGVCDKQNFLHKALAVAGCFVRWETSDATSFADAQSDFRSASARRTGPISFERTFRRDFRGPHWGGRSTNVDHQRPGRSAHRAVDVG